VLLLLLQSPCACCIAPLLHMKAQGTTLLLSKCRSRCVATAPSLLWVAGHHVRSLWGLLRLGWSGRWWGLWWLWLRWEWLCVLVIHHPLLLLVVLLLGIHVPIALLAGHAMLAPLLLHTHAHPLPPLLLLWLLLLLLQLLLLKLLLLKLLLPQLPPVVLS
jgi:hypothetical protein